MAVDQCVQTAACFPRKRKPLVLSQTAGSSSSTPAQHLRLHDQSSLSFLSTCEYLFFESLQLISTDMGFFYCTATESTTTNCTHTSDRDSMSGEPYSVAHVLPSRIFQNMCVHACISRASAVSRALQALWTRQSLDSSGTWQNVHRDVVADNFRADKSVSYPSV